MPAGKAGAYHVGPDKRKAMASTLWGNWRQPAPQREKDVKSVASALSGVAVRAGSSYRVSTILGDAPSAHPPKREKGVKKRRFEPEESPSPQDFRIKRAASSACAVSPLRKGGRRC